MRRAAPTRLYKRFAAEGVIAAAYKVKTIAILRINGGFIRCVYRCFEVCDVHTYSVPPNFSSITGHIASFFDPCLFDENRTHLVSTDKSKERFLASISNSY